jgi:excinuclease UvrABC nuclease subunit
VIIEDQPIVTIPAAPGVYFLWVGCIVVYVGQSINLRQRLTSRHHGFSHGCRASFLEFPCDELNFAEAFYIGIMRPVRNFGKKGVARWGC